MLLSLKNKIFIATIPIIIIALSIFTIIFFFSAKKAIENKNQAFIDEIVKTKAFQIGLYIEEIKRELKIISKGQELTNGDLYSDSTLKYIKHIANLNKDIFEILIISDNAGNTISSNDIKVNISDREYFKNIISRKSKLEISEPLISRVLKKPVYVIAVPLYDKNNKIKGIVAAVILIEKASKSIQDLHIKGKCNVGIMDKSGFLIAHQSKQYSLRISMYNVFEKSIKTLNKDFIRSNGHFIFKNNHQSIYISYSEIPNTDGWILCISIPEKIMYEDIYKLLSLLLFMFFIITSILSTIFYILIKRATKPLGRLTKAVKEFSKNSSEKKFNFTTKDEVDELFNTFNTMSKTISNHTKILD